MKLHTPPGGEQLCALIMSWGYITPIHGPNISSVSRFSFAWPNPNVKEYKKKTLHALPNQMPPTHTLPIHNRHTMCTDIQKHGHVHERTKARAHVPSHASTPPAHKPPPPRPRTQAHARTHARPSTHVAQ